MPLTATPMTSDATIVDKRLCSRMAAHNAAVPAMIAMITEIATSSGL
jgi:hypothetical protein